MLSTDAQAILWQRLLYAATRNGKIGVSSPAHTPIFVCTGALAVMADAYG